MKSMTADEFALRIMLSAAPPAVKQKQLARAATLAKAAIGCGFEGACPDCGHHGVHDDNGEKGEEQTFCCYACGSQFDFQRLTEEC